MSYLISTSKKRYTVAHLLAPDGVHALCTYKPGEKTWPSVGGKVTGGEWVLSEERGDRLICSVCLSKQNAPPQQPTEPKVNKRLARDIDRWRKFTGTEPQKLPIDTGKGE